MALFNCSTKNDPNYDASTTIVKWQNDKKSAVTISFDDGLINQFTSTIPVLNQLQLPATFYVITGKIPGAGKPKFIGRPLADILKESVSPTTSENFFERASAIGFYDEGRAIGYHTRAGELLERGQEEAAMKVIDDGFEILRTGKPSKINDIIYHVNDVDTTTWDDLKKYIADGHEIGSHTVSHPRLSVLDSANMFYELIQSKNDIERYLGKEATFSAECPYGTEYPRVMEAARLVYPSLRNRLFNEDVEEFNRGSQEIPLANTEYIQWQRGILTNTTEDVMESWVDSSLVHNNRWLVLVIHGVDGIGWESKSTQQLETYFKYIKSKEDQVWVATFADVVKYIRERENAKVESFFDNGQIKISLSSTLDPEWYHLPLTLKTLLPKNWEKATITDNETGEIISSTLISSENETFSIVYPVIPGKSVTIKKSN